MVIFLCFKLCFGYQILILGTLTQRKYCKKTNSISEIIRSHKILSQGGRAWRFGITLYIMQEIEKYGRLQDYETSVLLPTWGT